MTEMKRVGDPEIAEDMDAQRFNWRFQRIGTVIMALVALAGLLVLIDDGQILDDRMRRSRVSEDDILEQARIAHGLERMDQIKYAVLERTGGISVVHRSGGRVNRF